MLKWKLAVLQLIQRPRLQKKPCSPKTEIKAPNMESVSGSTVIVDDFKN